MSTIPWQGFNPADLVILLILCIGFTAGLKKGIVGMTLKVVYSIASFGASLIFYPLVSQLIRQTPLFDLMKEKIISTLGLELDTSAMLQSYTKQQEVNIISSLRLPQPLKDKLLENNNSVIYELIGADSFIDYIAGFVANLVINLVLVTILFVLFLLLLRIFFKGLELLSRLPVIGTFNRLGGAIMGLSFAVIIIWLGSALIYAFITKPAIYSLYECISSSRLAVWFYNNNLLLYMVLKRMF